MTAGKRAIVAGIAYFALVFAAGFGLGIFRVTLLVPRVGVRFAELLEMPIMLAVVVLSARAIVRRFTIERANRGRLVMGGVAFALAIAAESLVVIGIQHQSLSVYLAGRDPVSGSVFALLLVVFAAAPLLLARLGPWSRAAL